MDLDKKIREYIFEPEKFFPQCHASTLTVLKDNDILAAWFGGTHEKHRDTAIWTSKRHAGKWNDPVKTADEEGVPCWNPVLFRDEDGIIYLFYKVGETIPGWCTKFIISNDEGSSWSRPKELVKGDRGGRGPVKNKVICLEDGTWLAPASIETATTWDAFVDISKDKGRTWIKSPVPIDRGKITGKGIIQPSLWASGNGNVHMLLRSTGGYIYRSDSDDNGKTWSHAYPVDLPNNNSGIDAARLENGDVVLVYNPVSGDWADRTPIVCSLSKDNGNTWGKELVLDHESGSEFSYPAVVTKNNEVYITYTWKRRSIVFHKLEQILNRS
jgi:predicted neuraminidase